MKILVPLKEPFNPDVVKVGIRLTKILRTSLRFLNVTDTSPMRGYLQFPEEVVSQMKQGGKDTLKKAVDLATKEGIKATTSIVEGTPHEEILKTAKNFDMVVLGIRRFSPEGAIGNVTQKIIGRSLKPIYLVEKDTKKFSNILVGIDGSEYSKRALDYSFEFAKMVGISKIFTIFVARSPEEMKVGQGIMKDVQESGKKSGIKVDTFIKEGHPVKEILKFSDERGVQTIIMGTTGKGTISRLFLGSVSRKVAAFGECGIIIVPYEK